MASIDRKEEVIVKVRLTGLDRDIPDDPATQKAFGLAAHYVLERLDFREDKPGEMLLASILQDIKTAMGVRAPRTSDPEDGPQPRAPGSAKKPAGAKAPAEPVLGPDGKPKRRPGRPPGSKNKPKEDLAAASQAAAAAADADNAEPGGEGDTGTSVNPAAPASRSILADPFQDP